MPLYRYQLRLRLARALDLLGQYDDLTALGLDLGLLEPQPLQRRVPAGLRSLASGVPALGAAALSRRAVRPRERMRPDR